MKNVFSELHHPVLIFYNIVALPLQRLPLIFSLRCYKVFVSLHKVVLPSNLRPFKLLFYHDLRKIMSNWPFCDICSHSQSVILHSPMMMVMIRIFSLFLLLRMVALEHHKLTPHLITPLCHDLLLKPFRHLLRRIQNHVVWN